MEKLPRNLLTKKVFSILSLLMACAWMFTVVAPSLATEDNPELTVHISISKDGFEPEISTISAGTTVIWTNKLSVPVSLDSSQTFRIFLPMVSNGGAQSTSRVDGTNIVESEDIYEMHQNWLNHIVLNPGESFSYTFSSIGKYPIKAEMSQDISGIIFVDENISNSQQGTETPTATATNEPPVTSTLAPASEPAHGKISISLITYPADGLDFLFTFNNNEFKLDNALQTDKDQVENLHNFTDLEPGQFEISLQSRQGYLNGGINCSSDRVERSVLISDQNIQVTLAAGEHVVCQYVLLKDSDQDRIADKYETNDGNFMDVSSTGTDPNNPDTDADGISDGDEILGTLGGLDLPGMGANPLRRTILVEYDWFEDSSTNKGYCGNEAHGFHSHRPNAAMVDEIHAVYANAPTVNPDGTTGIDMIQDYGQGGLFTGGNKVAKNNNGLIAGSVYSNSFTELKAEHFAANRRSYFHYVILAHQFSSTSNFSSGNAEINGNDAIVSVYNYFCSNEITGNTIVHELGHNLGLLHGGHDDLNNKPNYNSVMNYRFQFSGIDSDESCDGWGDGISGYSTGGRITLDENNLHESHGVCGESHHGMDWNNDGDMIDSGLSRNINADSSMDVLKDHNDWQNLYFLGILSESSSRSVQNRDIRPVEISSEYQVPDHDYGRSISSEPIKSFSTSSNPH